MAIVDEPTLRKFSTARFYQDGLGARLEKQGETAMAILRLVGPTSDEVLNLLNSPTTFIAVNAWIERAGWHALGAQIGCFDALEPFSEDDRSLLSKALEFSDALDRPKPFRDLARDLSRGDTPKLLELDVPYSDPETLAIFQAAMTVADGFTDPLVASLQLSLQVGESVLNGDQKQVDGAEVLMALEQSRDDTSDAHYVRPNLRKSVAGLLRLIELLAALDDIFPSML